MMEEKIFFFLIWEKQCHVFMLSRVAIEENSKYGNFITS